MRQAVWVVISWTVWGGFLSTGAWLQQALPDPWFIVWIALSCLGLGVVAALLSRWLPFLLSRWPAFFRDQTTSFFLAGAAIAGLAGAIAGGMIVTGLGGRLGFGFVGLLGGLISGLGASASGLMVVHLGLAKTLQLVSEESQKQPRGPA
jgi:hypothetical protein